MDCPLFVKIKYRRVSTNTTANWQDLPPNDAVLCNCRLRLLLVAIASRVISGSFCFEAGSCRRLFWFLLVAGRLWLCREAGRLGLVAGTCLFCGSVIAICSTANGYLADRVAQGTYLDALPLQVKDSLFSRFWRLVLWLIWGAERLGFRTLSAPDRTVSDKTNQEAIF